MTRFLHSVPRPIALACSLALLAACAEEKVAEEPTQRRPGRLIHEAPSVEPLPEDTQPSPLIGPFRSLMTLDEAIAALHADQPFEVSMNNRAKAPGTCPGQHLMELQVKRFWDLDRKGTLILQFQDELLAQVWFKTFDADGYRSEFFAMHGLERGNRWKPTYLLPGSVITNPIAGNEGLLIEDFRMRAHTRQVELACRHQFQKEQGLLDDPSKVAAGS